MGFVDELRGVLGSDRVKDHPLELHIYDKDAGVTRGPVTAVALPETTEETAHCVLTARRWDVPIVARGAGTGLAGGAAAAQEPEGSTAVFTPADTSTLWASSIRPRPRSTTWS